METPILDKWIINLDEANELGLLTEKGNAQLTEFKAIKQALSLSDVVGQSEQLVCPHCKGKGEYIDTHPERYGLKTCECQRAN